MPGLGSVAVQRKAAISDFVDHVFLPPSYSFQWNQADTNPSPGFYKWLADELNTTEEEAALKVNEYVGELKREINAGKEINWEGVGIIRRGMDSGIELETGDKQLDFEQEVFAEKVIHPDSSHTILVGDEEKSSADMNQFLGLFQRKKITKHRLILWIAAFALVLFIIYMSVTGWSPVSVSNKNGISPNDAPASYKEIK